MANIGYTERLERIRDALRATDALAGYRIDYRPQGVVEEVGPWVELYLDRVERDQVTIGKSVGSPYEATMVIVARVVAPGVDFLASLSARDAMMDRLTEGIREAKAAGSYDLAGLWVGNEQFNEYREEAGGSYYAEALVDLNWLTKA